MRASLFWDVTERGVVVTYRRFSTNYHSHLQSLNSLLGLPDPWRWDRYVALQRLLLTINLRCVTSQKNEDLLNMFVTLTNVDAMYDFTTFALPRNITTADAHTSAASSRLNWRPRRFKWTRPFRRKTKSGFCACAITFQTQSTNISQERASSLSG
jgi:hypothetical protein